MAQVRLKPCRPPISTRCALEVLAALSLCRGPQLLLKANALLRCSVVHTQCNTASFTSISSEPFPLNQPTGASEAAGLCCYQPQVLNRL